MPLHSALLTVRDVECGFSNIMNRKIVTLGVAAFGVVGLQAADAGKVWEVTGSLRGFYDDNYTTSPEAAAEESWGIEVSPGINLTIGEGTDLEFSAGYAFGMRYYEDRETDNEDYGHELGISLSKAFSNTSLLQLSDSFVIAQEPEILNGGTPHRVPRVTTCATRFQPVTVRFFQGTFWGNSDTETPSLIMRRRFTLRCWIDPTTK